MTLLRRCIAAFATKMPLFKSLKKQAPAQWRPDRHCQWLECLIGHEKE
jgi:hypothetical protein